MGIMTETASWRLCILCLGVVLLLASVTSLIVSFVALHDARAALSVDNLVSATAAPSFAQQQQAALSAMTKPNNAVKASLRASLLKNAQAAERKLVSATNKLFDDIDVVDKELPPLVDDAAPIAAAPSKTVRVLVQEEKRNDIHLARGVVNQRGSSIVKVPKPNQSHTVAPTTPPTAAGVGVTLRKVKTLQQAFNAKKQ